MKSIHDKINKLKGGLENVSFRVGELKLLRNSWMPAGSSSGAYFMATESPGSKPDTVTFERETYQASSVLSMLTHHLENTFFFL